MKWCEQRMADLVEQESDKATKLSELSDKLTQSYNSDGWDEAKQETYDRDQLRHGQLSRELLTVRDEISKLRLLKPEEVKRQATTALSRFLRGGHNQLEEAEIKEFGEPIDDSFFSMGGTRNAEVFVIKSATASDADSGIEVTDIETRRDVITALKEFGGLDRMCYQFDTDVGTELRMPQHDDSSKKGVIIGSQGANIPEDGLNDFGSLSFLAKTMRSGRIRITREMIQDAIIDISGFAQAMAARRMGRGWDEVFTIITGSSLAANAPANGTLPEAVIISLERGLQTGHTTAGSNTITREDLIEAIYSVARAYRNGGETGQGGIMGPRGGRVGWLLSDGAEKALRKLKDGDGRPLWQPHNDSIAGSGQSGMLLGYPYEVSEVLNGTLADDSEKDVIFGNFSYYGIRNVNAVEMFRFMDSRTMENNEVEIMALSRRFGRPMVNGPTPGAGNRWTGIEQIKSMKIMA